VYRNFFSKDSKKLNFSLNLMKKIFLFATLRVLSMGIFKVIFLQNMNILEKDYEISRKAKKGYLGGVEKKENGNFDLIYFSPSTLFGQAVVETYTFDKECNLLNTVREKLETEKIRKRYKGFTYKGEYFIANTLSASTNYMGKLVFRKKINYC
jgi:hypothetical protein